ncbi:MAG: hypothetical protein HY028_03045 [Gammaproteobacteria bacterium]|nr:hypothetical protein [Gammaproteobacteria bacterium]
MQHIIKNIFYAAGLASLIVNAAQASCGSAFCSINTGAEAQGDGHDLQKHLDLRYEFIDQSQQRRGRNEVSGEFNSDDELEKRTINRNLIATLDYPVNTRWAWSFQLPLISRDHTHDTLLEPESWQFTEIGDVRVTGRYLLNEPRRSTMNSGVKFGLKLPTGSFEITNSEGAEAERSLQPGTGTTDLLLGAFYTQPLASGQSSWFAEGLWQKPLAEHQHYRPGQRFTIDLGLRHTLNDRLRVLLQLNGLWRGLEQGEAANPTDSGGTFVYLSPGLSYSLAGYLEVYGFFQQPLYQRVNGLQLTADWSAALGVTYRF